MKNLLIIILLSLVACAPKLEVGKPLFNYYEEKRKEKERAIAKDLEEKAMIIKKEMDRRAFIAKKEAEKAAEIERNKIKLEQEFIAAQKKRNESGNLEKLKPLKRNDFSGEKDIKKFM